VDAHAPRLPLLLDYVRDYPRDALIVDQAITAISFSGRADREEYRLRLLRDLDRSYGEDWWFDSALAFALHEVGRLEEARRLCERSLTNRPTNAGAVHSYAHLFYEAADNTGGTRFLRPWLERYDPRAMLHSHLSWHLALFELQRGEPDVAHRILREAILPTSNRNSAVVDGASLLWRLALDGYSNNGAEWRLIAAIASTIGREASPFLSMHAAFAYGSCGDEGSIAALERAVDLAQVRGSGRGLGLTIIRAITAFVRGDRATCVRLLAPIEKEFHRIGGSRAQWEILEETLVMAYFSLGQYEEAMPLVRRRVARRATPRDLHWLQLADGYVPAAAR